MPKQIAINAIKFNLVFSLMFFLMPGCLASSTNSPIQTINKNIHAIVSGRIINKKVVKSGNLYLTEYRLKIKNWLFKKNNIKTSKYITLKVLGADLEKEGIIIKASTSPDFIPMHKDAIFLLTQNKKTQKNVFTLSKNSIIYDDNSFSLKPKDIQVLFKKIEDM
ncbi:MAG: hypothetical protein A3B68_01825 [Candidatus Melainabacteria bacterium RIFCSPHIGHO2_02_FULL_34_12]|nr:MAG: hypothetical protein A3B68_01825 [Candidatus Melainabacteria bacterium RIFCSPHIGHO2_02_FULL_34_12]